MMRRLEKERGKAEGKKDEMEKEGKREKRTRGKRKRRKNKQSNQKLLKVQVVINRKKKCLVSGTDKPWTGRVHMSSVKGVPRVSKLAGSDTQACWLLTLNELKVRAHSYSFGQTSSSCKVTISWQGLLSISQRCWKQGLLINSGRHNLTSRMEKLRFLRMQRKEDYRIKEISGFLVVTIAHP